MAPKELFQKKEEQVRLEAAELAEQAEEDDALQKENDHTKIDRRVEK